MIADVSPPRDSVRSPQPPVPHSWSLSPTGSEGDAGLPHKAVGLGQEALLALDTGQLPRGAACNHPETSPPGAHRPQADALPVTPRAHTWTW